MAWPDFSLDIAFPAVKMCNLPEMGAIRRSEALAG
jgi:hypothetical protein